MSKGSDKKRFDENFDRIDWGDVVSKPHPQWKEADFRYDYEWISLWGGVCWGSEGKNDELP